MGFVSILDFLGDFVFLEHRRNEQTGIKTIFDHFRNTHARLISNFLEILDSDSKCPIQGFSMEPDMVKWMAWNTSEIKLAMSLDESMKLLK